MLANCLSKISSFDIYKKIGIFGILLLIVSCAANPQAFIPATASFIPLAISPAAASTTQNIKIRYILDRSDIPQLTYNAVTLKIFVGEAASVSAKASGKDIPLVYDSGTGFVTVTTSANVMDLSIISGVQTTKTGSFTKTPLKDDRQWSWSHSFDDNTGFKEYGISGFDQYGWRATVYLIGSKIDAAINESWIVDHMDIESLLKKGWGIGNHTWTHSSVNDPLSAKQDVMELAVYLRKLADNAGYPDYRLMSFAAPNFDSNYHPIILDLRNSHASELLLNESGSDAIKRVDPGVTDDVYDVFDPDAPVGRDWRIQEYGTNNETDLAFRADLAKMLSSMDSTHHFWLNTFNHDVDSRYPSTSIFAFLSWIYKTYGPKGNNSVWVAPSEEIYSYLLVRDRIKVSFSFVDPDSDPNPEPTTIHVTVVPTNVPTRYPVDSRLYFLPVVDIRQ